MATKIKLTAAQKKDLISKGQRNKPGPKPGSKRKPATKPPAPDQEPVPAPEPKPPVAQDPPEPPAPVAPDPPQPPQPAPVLQQFTADDIMNEIDSTFKAHNEALAVQQAQTPIPVAETPVNGSATQQNTIVATNPVNPAAQVAQAGNAANDALSRLIDPELIILSCDLLLSNLLTLVFRKVAKFDVKQKDFALTGSERRDITTLLDGWMKSRQKSIMTPGWALLMGVAGVYAGKGVSVIGADKIKPVAPPPPVALEPGAEAAPAQTMANAYQEMITRQNTELLNTLQVMQSKIEALDKKVNSAAKKRPGNKNAAKKGTVLPLNKTGT